MEDTIWTCTPGTEPRDTKTGRDTFRRINSCSSSSGCARAVGERIRGRSARALAQLSAMNCTCALLLSTHAGTSFAVKSPIPPMSCCAWGAVAKTAAKFAMSAGGAERASTHEFQQPIAGAGSCSSEAKG